MDELLVKFPRTQHLLDLGAATRDDLTLSKEDARGLLRSIICLGERGKPKKGKSHADSHIMGTSS